MMDDDSVERENGPYALQGSSDTLLSIQMFEFKTQLLEAVEELRMERIAKLQYEEQIRKILMEKQELAWQNETLSNEAQITDKRHKEALAAFQKKLQVKMCSMEEEKGQLQLAAETKKKEIIGLKEDLKALQMSKYNLEKKLHEMEQKADGYLLAKEDHIKQMNEFEKCFATVSRQFGITKEAHEKLEQNVQEAIKQNQKLKLENEEMKETADHLKEELNKLSQELERYKMMSQQREGEEKTSLLEKNQQLRELRQKLQTEAEVNKQLMETNTSLKKEKQEDMQSVDNLLQLIQRHTQTIVNTESELTLLKEGCRTLERDNELQRAKARENEEKFFAVQSELEKALVTWKTQEESMKMEINTVVKELESMKKAYKALQECPSELSVHQCQNNKNVAVMQTSKDTLSREGSKDAGSGDSSGLQSVSDLTDAASVSEVDDEPSHKNNTAKASNSPESITHGETEVTENIRVDGICLSKSDEHADCDPGCRTCIKEAQVVVGSVKMLLDNNKPLTVSSETSLLTDSSHHKSADVTNKGVYIGIDKEDGSETDEGVFINESEKQESRLFPEPTEQPANQTTLMKEDSQIGNTRQDGNSYQVQKQGMAAIEGDGCQNVYSKQKIKDPTYVSDKGTDALCTDTRPCKQNSIDEGNAMDFDSEVVEVKCTNNTDCSESSALSYSPSDKDNAITMMAGMRNEILSRQNDCSVLPLPTDSPIGSEELQKNIPSQIAREPPDNSQASEKPRGAVNPDGAAGNITLHTSQTTESKNRSVDRSNTTTKAKLCAERNAALCQVKPQSTEIGNKDGKHCSAQDELKDRDSYAKEAMGEAPLLECPAELVKSLPDLKYETTDPQGMSAPKDKCTDLAKVKGYTLKSQVGDNPPMNTHTMPMNDDTAKWNAIAETFQESITSPENRKVVMKPGTPSTSKQDKSLIGITSYKNLFKKTKIFAGSPTDKEKDSSAISIQEQISEIETFLINQRLRGSKKRKMEDISQVGEEQPEDVIFS